MKQILVSTAFAMVFAVMAVGCAGDTAGSSETGSVSVNLIVGDTDVTAVAFEVECDSGITLNGNFNVVDDRDPPVWATIMDLPVGICTVTLIAQDDTGATLCTASENVEVLENQTVKVDLVLECTIDAEEALGNIDIDATFEIIEGNLCPRLHFLNAVPINVPASGSEVTVLVSDGNGDTLTTALTATSGSFGDPAALSTTYTCDAGGTQTISVSVTDGDAACDKSKSFDVVCPGVDPCEGVVCDDTGNECTAAECVDGVCVVSNVDNGTVCGGGGGELTVNGDFETGDTTGWEFFANDGTFGATSAQANGGTYSGNLVASVAAGGPPSFPVIKQANIGIGTAQPNSSCDISFDLFGSVSGAGGVFFAEFFSELSGGGTSSSVILGGGPLFPNGTWTNYSYTTPTGNDVSGGVTLQLKADCGANPGCTVDAYIDNVSVNCGSGGEAGTCQEGVCVSNDLCQGVTCDDTGNECTAAECNPANGLCEVSNVADGTACDGGNGTCSAGACQPNDLCVGVTCDDTGNDCTAAACNPANGLCEVSNVADGTACDGGTGTCDAGVCAPSSSCEYTQDFEALTPGDPPQGQPTDLAADGWVVGANVFESDGTTFAYDYFAFPAPNGGPAFSAVATGEGGAPQGAQQMSIYNDYNNADHGVGRIIEAIVFRERTIAAGEIGSTLTFTFDAKAGNIEGATTALAFIKTLDPGASFATTNFITQDTTNLPATWGTFTLSLPIDAGLVGQILQIGAQSRASNFEGSGILYDNMEICSE